MNQGTHSDTVTDALNQASDASRLISRKLGELAVVHRVYGAQLPEALKGSMSIASAILDEVKDATKTVESSINTVQFQAVASQYVEVDVAPVPSEDAVEPTAPSVDLTISARQASVDALVEDTVKTGSVLRVYDAYVRDLYMISQWVGTLSTLYQNDADVATSIERIDQIGNQLKALRINLGLVESAVESLEPHEFLNYVLDQLASDVSDLVERNEGLSDVVASIPSRIEELELKLEEEESDALLDTSSSNMSFEDEVKSSDVNREVLDATIASVGQRIIGVSLQNEPTEKEDDLSEYVTNVPSNEARKSYRDQFNNNQSGLTERLKVKKLSKHTPSLRSSSKLAQAPSLASIHVTGADEQVQLGTQAPIQTAVEHKEALTSVGVSSNEPIEIDASEVIQAVGDVSPRISENIVGEQPIQAIEEVVIVENDEFEGYDVEDEFLDSEPLAIEDEFNEMEESILLDEVAESMSDTIVYADDDDDASF